MKRIFEKIRLWLIRKLKATPNEVITQTMGATVKPAIFYENYHPIPLRAEVINPIDVPDPIAIHQLYDKIFDELVKTNCISWKGFYDDIDHKYKLKGTLLVIPER